MEKPDPYHPSLLHFVTIKGFQVLLSSITCLPSYPTQGEGICLTLPPTQYACLIQSANDPQDPQSHSLYPGYKSGLRTPVQCWISLEMACCSNNISHSNKLYFPLILSHVWKFFSNPRLYHDTYYVWHVIYLPLRKKNIKLASKSPQCQHSNHIFLGF